MFRDETAASPLTVIVVFTLAAVLVTVGIYALFFDRPPNDVDVVAAQQDGRPVVEVTSTSGGLTWGELDIGFIDRAGADRSSFLVVPQGKIRDGDRIVFQLLPPGGEYLLTLSHKDGELARLSLQF